MKIKKLLQRDLLSNFQTIEKEKINTLVKLHNFRYHCTRSFRSTDHISKWASCSACVFNKSNHRLFNKYFEESYIKSFFVHLNFQVVWIDLHIKNYGHSLAVLKESGADISARAQAAIEQVKAEMEGRGFDGQFGSSYDDAMKEIDRMEKSGKSAVECLSQSGC